MPDGQKNSPPCHDLKEHASAPDYDPYLVSLISPPQDPEHPQSENIMTVLDEMQGTAMRRRTQVLKPDLKNDS